jgi:hypothetical protein
MAAGSKASLTVNKFEIKSNSNGKTFDIAKGDAQKGIPGKTPVIEYRESVLTPFVEIKTVLVDEGTAIPDGEGYTDVMNGLKICGTEEVKFQITDGAGNTIRLTNSNDLRLGKPGVTLQAYKSNRTELVIYSKEVFDDTLLQNEVTSKLEGKISEAVSRILKDNLKSNKSLQIDQTTNKVENEIGDARRPFDVILGLQEKAIPSGVSNSVGSCAGYLFWQTSLAFYFKSLDKIFDGNPVLKFVFNNKVSQVPPGFDDKILDYKVVRTQDVLENMKSGFLCSSLSSFNRRDHTYTTKILTANNSSRPIAGKELPRLHSDYFEKPTVRLEAEVPFGAWTLGDSMEKRSEKSDQPAWSVQDVIQQSRHNYRQKFSIVAEITIPCNLSLHAGDLIYCDFPERARKTTMRRDPQSSGIYMISDLCHYTNTTQAFTKLRLVRDSFGVR